MSPSALRFENVVPSWCHCLRMFRTYSFSGTGKALDAGLENLKSYLFPIYFLLSCVVQDVGFRVLALTTMPVPCLPPSWTSSLSELHVQIDSFFCNLLFCSWCFIAESEKKPIQMLNFTHLISYYTSWSRTDRNNRELFVRNLLSDILHRIFYSSGAGKVDSAIWYIF